MSNLRHFIKAINIMRGKGLSQHVKKIFGFNAKKNDRSKFLFLYTYNWDLQIKGMISTNQYIFVSSTEKDGVVARRAEGFETYPKAV